MFSNDPNNPNYGPAYPKMAGLDKFRAVARNAGGVMTLEKFYRNEYGAAVEKAIRSLQKTEARAGLKTLSNGSNSCSGYPYGDAKGVERAIRGKIASENARCVREAREGRTDEQVKALYDEAMKAKRELEGKQREKAKRSARRDGGRAQEGAGAF